MRSWGWIPHDETSAFIGETPRELPGPFLQVGTLGEVGHLGTRKLALRLRICQYFGLGLPELWKKSISYFINHSVRGIFVIVIQTILSPRDTKSRLIAKRPWCWERLKAGGEGDDRGWDGWMASLAQRTWIWANSGRQWRTGKPDILQSMGSRRVGYNLATEQQQQSKDRIWAASCSSSGQLFLVQRCSRKNCLAPEKHGYVVSFKKDQSLDKKEHRDTLFKTLGVQGVGEDLGYSVVWATK